MGKHTVVYPSQGMPLRDEVQQTVDTCSNCVTPQRIVLNEKVQLQRVTYYMIPFMLYS